MDMFRSMTQTVLGSTTSDQAPSGADTVERVVERVVSSSLLEDRRDGCRALRALARKYRLLVGAHAMDALLQALENDRTDYELVNYVLETLITITSPEPFQEEIEEAGDIMACNGLGQQFTEIVTKKTDNIALFLGLLDEAEFKVRYPTIKLFSNLLENQARGVQEAVLNVPSGVSKLMDLLSDSREVIRNHMLLLLTHLTRGNTTLQKIIVFDNIFDHLFGIMREEGYSDGGVVVEDCLELLLTLVRNSVPNQTLLRDGGYIHHITTFFTTLLDEAIEDKDNAWHQQKVANVHKMLELVTSLVQPTGAQAEVSLCQSQLRSKGVLAALCRLLLASGVPGPTLTLTITTLAYVIRADIDNQQFLTNVVAPSTPPRPAVLVLLMSLVNEKQGVPLRCAVLYCIHCLLERNQQLQSNLIATLLPQTSQAEEISSGQLLCGGLFSGDPVSTWLCAVALTHALRDNTDQKDQLLRVQLATGSGCPSVSLLQQCCTVLHATTAFLVRAALLQLIASWLLQCPRAVTQLLGIPGVMAHLTAQISSSESDDQESQVVQGLCAFVVGVCALYNEAAPGTLTRAQLAALVNDRIGSHVFCNKLSGLARTELYSLAAKSAKLSANTKAELAFDYGFITMYRTLEGSLLRAVNIGEAGAGELLEKQVAELQEKLDAAVDQVNSLTAEKQQLAASVQHLTQQLQQQQQQQHPVSSGGGDAGAALHQQVAELTYARDYYYYQMVEKDKLLQQQQLVQSQQEQQQIEQQKTNVEQQKTNVSRSPAVTNATTNGVVSNGAQEEEEEHHLPDPELETLRCQLQDLQLVLQKKDEMLYQLQQQGTAPVPNSSHEDLQSRLQASEQSRVLLADNNKELQLQLQDSRTQLQTMQTPITDSSIQEEESKSRKQLQAELASVQCEQEDLLLLLSEQDGRLQRYKSHLTVRGVTPPPGEEDDDDDEDDEGSLQ